MDVGTSAPAASTTGLPPRLPHAASWRRSSVCPATMGHPFGSPPLGRVSLPRAHHRCLIPVPAAAPPAPRPRAPRHLPRCCAWRPTGGDGSKARTAPSDMGMVAPSRHGCLLSPPPGMVALSPPPPHWRHPGGAHDAGARDPGAVAAVPRP
jgi:hypothetical protein